MSILTMHHGLMAGIKKAPVGNFVHIGQNDYPYIKIGNLLWITTNLKETIGNSEFYNDTEKYGQYYYWNELMSNTGTPTQALSSILPPGWRIPTSADFSNTQSAIGASQIPAMKSETDWTGGGGNGTNASGLNMYPTGRKSGATWEGVGSVCYLARNYFSNRLMSSFAMSNYITDQLMADNYNKCTVRLVKDAT